MLQEKDKLIVKRITVLSIQCDEPIHLDEL